MPTLTLSPENVLAYEVRGKGPPVVFIQGVGIHGAGWAPQVDALAGEFTCLWFDNRGIGGSVGSSDNLSVPIMARDALALMDHLGWEAAHLVGHSMGGLIALELALAARQRVSGLALLCTFADGRQAGNSARMIWLGTRTRVGTRRMRRNAFSRSCFHPSFCAAPTAMPWPGTSPRPSVMTWPTTRRLR
jgi:pimeloyl-ACP methyl ester carboxylesterase